MNQKRNAQREANVEQMYARYGAVIYSRARNLLRNEADAEDATQDIFLRVFARQGSVPADEVLLPWMHRICTNYCLNLLRNKKSRNRDVSVLYRDTERFDETVERRNYAEALFSRMKHHVAVVAKGCYVDEDEQQVVAERLNISRRTVNTRLKEFSDTAKQLAAVL